MSELAKAILDKWATVVIRQSAIFIQNGQAQVNQNYTEYYKAEKYAEDVCLWIPPKNCIRIEFEDTPANNEKWISILISNAKALNIDFCITLHEGGKSAYFNAFNFTNIPLNEDNSNAKNLLIDRILPKEAKAYLDRTNLGWTLSPVIDHPHWKPKYKGAIHRVVEGKNPLEHKNKLPTEILHQLTKSRKQNTKVIQRYSNSGWAEDFLLNYCLNNPLPVGQRHTIIEKNFAALIIHRPDKQELKDKYFNTQNQTPGSMEGWERGILNGNYTEVSLGELRRYIQDNNIPYEIKTFELPDTVKADDEKMQIITALQCNDRSKATELITQKIKSTNHIYTTRDDEKEEVWVYDAGIYIPQGKTRIKEECRRILGEAYTNHLANEVISKIETDTYIESDRFFNNLYPELVVTQNCIINVITGDVHEYTPQKIFFNKIPVKYDQEKKCPNIIQHLKDVLKNEEDLPVMQELFGFCLLKEYKYEKAFMLVGDGRNGKGKTVELFKHFLGVENCTNVSLQQLENDAFSMGELFKKMANISADINATTLKETGKFKSLTGRDLVSAQRKFLPMVNFINYAKMIFCCNKIPRTTDTTNAFWSRMTILEFPYTFLSKNEINEIPEKDRKNLKEADPEIVAKLTTPEELSGLLNWALEGLKRLETQKGFSHSQSTKEVQEIWTRKSDSFAAFMMDCMIEKAEGRVPKSLLRECYVEYCKIYRLKPLGEKLMRQNLMEIGAWEERSQDLTRVREWVGVDFVQAVQSVQAFCTLYQKKSLPRSINTLDKSDRLDRFVVSEENLGGVL